LGHGLEEDRSVTYRLGIGLVGGSAGEPAGGSSIHTYGDRMEA